MNYCCEQSVPQPDSSFETFARPVADWQARLTDREAVRDKKQEKVR